MELWQQEASWPGHLDSSGRIVIPVESRRSLGWGQGTDVVIESDGDTLRILTLEQFTRETQDLFGQAEEGEQLLSEQLIAERREAARQEANQDD